MARYKMRVTRVISYALQARMAISFTVVVASLLRKIWDGTATNDECDTRMDSGKWHLHSKSLDLPLSVVEYRPKGGQVITLMLDF